MTGFTKVFIRNLEVQAHIGVHGHEQGTPQPVRINVTLDVTTQVRQDRLEEVVDYERIAENIRDLIGHGHINLAETLAESIAALCLENNRVSKAVVRVEKLRALAGAEAAGVEVERTRS